MRQMMMQVDARPSPADTPWDPSWWPTGGSSLPMELIGYVFLGLGVVVVAWMGWQWGRRSWQRMEPLRLFMRFGRNLELSRTQMWWLWRVARQQGLTSPITLLLSPATHDHHVQQFVANRGGRPGEDVPRPLATVREQLFGPREEE